MTNRYRKPLLYCALWLATQAAHAAAGTDTAIPPLPTWQALEFEHQALWLTARSEVTLTEVPGDHRQWLLTATSSVASNSEEVQLNLAALDGRVLQRSRLGRGKDQRLKSHEFLADLVVRERRIPETDPAAPAAQWPLRSRKKIPYPARGESMVITDAYALLMLAGRFQASGDSSAELMVNTDLNFYRVRMSPASSGAITVNYRLAGTDQTVSGRRETRGVRLQISPAGVPAEKPDFSLLGLQDNITIVFDSASDLPLQIRGVAPRLGSTEINLKSVTPRTDSPTSGAALPPPA